MNADRILDVKGLACPMPIVRAKKAADEMKPGEVLELHATDSGSEKDIPAWAKASGHELLQQTEENGVYKFWIRIG